MLRIVTRISSEVYDLEEKCDTGFKNLKTETSQASIFIALDRSNKIKVHVDIPQYNVGKTFIRVDENIKNEIIALFS